MPGMSRTALEHARAQHQVGAPRPKRRQEPRQFGWVLTPVTVQKRHQADPRTERLDTGPAGRSVAPARFRHDPRPGRAGDGRRAVGGSIVHDYEIVHEPRRHRAQDGRNRSLLVGALG